MSKPRLEDLPERYQAQARAQLAGLAHPRTIAIEPAPHLPARASIRQKTGDGMNKWERAFLAYLRDRKPGASIHREPSLPLANGLRYKLDFLTGVPSEYGAQVHGYEVKGFRRPTGIAKLKMAATVYPWIEFFLVTKPNGRDWLIERVEGDQLKAPQRVLGDHCESAGHHSD